jgi:hypothetical protein
MPAHAGTETNMDPVERHSHSQRRRSSAVGARPERISYDAYMLQWYRYGDSGP